MKYQIPIYNEEGKIVPLEVEAEDIFEAMDIVRKQNIHFIDSYVSVCWYNGANNGYSPEWSLDNMNLCPISCMPKPIAKPNRIAF